MATRRRSNGCRTLVLQGECHTIAASVGRTEVQFRGNGEVLGQVDSTPNSSTLACCVGRQLIGRPAHETRIARGRDSRRCGTQRDINWSFVDIGQSNCDRLIG